MAESSPWTVDHPAVQAIQARVQRMIPAEWTVSLEAVCRILQGIDKHRSELRLEADDPRIHETLDAMAAIAAEGGQSEEIVWAVVTAYSGAMGTHDFRYTADDPLVRALASTLSLRPEVVSAVLRRDHEFLAREGLDEEALLRRVAEAMMKMAEATMKFYFGELPPSDDAP